MDQGFVLLLVFLTSAAAYLYGSRRLRLRRSRLAAALGRMLDCAGATLVFFGLNLAAGFVLTLAARAVSGRFVSLYPGTDLSLLVLSLIQGLTFEWWRHSASH